MLSSVFAVLLVYFIQNFKCMVLQGESCVIRERKTLPRVHVVIEAKPRYSYKTILAHVPVDCISFRFLIVVAAMLFSASSVKKA